MSDFDFEDEFFNSPSALRLSSSPISATPAPKKKSPSTFSQPSQPSRDASRNENSPNNSFDSLLNEHNGDMSPQISGLFNDMNVEQLFGTVSPRPLISRPSNSTSNQTQNLTTSTSHQGRMKFPTKPQDSPLEESKNPFSENSFSDRIPSTFSIDSINSSSPNPLSLPNTQNKNSTQDSSDISRNVITGDEYINSSTTSIHTLTPKSNSIPSPANNTLNISSLNSSNPTTQPPSSKIQDSIDDVNSPMSNPSSYLTPSESRANIPQNSSSNINSQFTNQSNPLSGIILKTLSNQGTLSKLRAIIRASVISGINEKNPQYLTNPNISSFLSQTENAQLCLELVFDLLNVLGLKYTRAILLQELGPLETDLSNIDTDRISDILDIPPTLNSDADADPSTNSDIPILAKILQIYLGAL